MHAAIVYNFGCSASPLKSIPGVLQYGEYLTSIVVRLREKVISYRSTVYHVEEHAIVGSMWNGE